jgi:hypothetical protein
VASVVGIDGCGKSSTYRGALDVLARRLPVVGIGDEVLGGGPDRGTYVRGDIPLTRSSRTIGRVSKGLKSPRVYKNLKFLELHERAHICRYVCRMERPGVVLSDGQPLINSAAWCASRYFCADLEDDELLVRSSRYLSGSQRIPVSEIPFFLTRAWQLVLVNWLGLGRFAPPDHVFLLDLDASVAMDRIRQRGKPLQAHETVEFLSHLGASYRRVCRLLAPEFGFVVTTVPVDEAPLQEAIRIVADAISERINPVGVS